jgi:exopolysaccharide production protein ExoY
MSIERTDLQIGSVANYAYRSFERGWDANLCGGRMKRVFDIVFSAAAIIVLSPLLIGLALMIRFSDGGPAFYGHTRVGHGGRLFKCWKFRSMAADSSRLFDEHLAASSEARHEWQTYGKLRNDPRVTPLGHILRKYSLDELPQLFNILLGEMSVVGPRPVAIEELAYYGSSKRYYRQCRPGLTGLWQVSGRSDLGYDKRVALDRCYITHWSMLLDISLIFRTFSVVLKGRGSY